MNAWFLTFADRTMTRPSHRPPEPIRFAYWVPNVSGGLVISKIEQRTSWEADYNRRLAQIAEEAGFDYALTQIRFTAGYGAEYQHESVAFSHALLAVTTKLKVIAALLPGPWNPTIAAKQIATISQLTNGRIAINVVSGWFSGEFRAIGEPWLDHDERYRRSEEFIRSLRGIWTQDDFTFRGDFYRYNQLHPEAEAGRPAARDLPGWLVPRGARHGGPRLRLVLHQRQHAGGDPRTGGRHPGQGLGQRPFGEGRRQRLRHRPRHRGRGPRRPPGDHRQRRSRCGEGLRPRGEERRQGLPEGEGNWAKSSFEDLVQYNDGFKTNLIGTPDQIAERIVALKDAGVDLALLAFLHFQEEVAYFGAHIIPKVRALEAARERRAEAA